MRRMKLLVPTVLLLFLTANYIVTTMTYSFRDNNQEPVTLVTHTTSEYTAMLVEQCSLWNGPISASLFVDRYSIKSIDILVSLIRCNPLVEQKLSLHVVYRRAAFQQKCEDVVVELIPCDQLTKEQNLGRVGGISPFGIYPINSMRNVARLGAASHFHLISDVEMVFSENFAEFAKKIANQNITAENKNVIVFRRFEQDGSMKDFPRNVAELRKRMIDKKVFEFHHNTYAVGHAIEGLWSWLNRTSDSEELPVLWEIPYTNSTWEPQFIMHGSAPLSEESIPTRMGDQQSFVYEICRADYTFLLASGLFNVHRGVKVKQTHMDSAVGQHQMGLKISSFRLFKDRLNRLYPNTIDRCHNFNI